MISFHSLHPRYGAVHPTPLPNLPRSMNDGRKESELHTTETAGPSKRRSDGEANRMLPTINVGTDEAMKLVWVSIPGNRAYRIAVRACNTA
jgi:hypothetical protein